MELNYLPFLLPARGYHLTRTGFFMFTGLVSVVAARQALGSATQSVAVSRFEELISRGWAGPFTEVGSLLPPRCSPAAGASPGHRGRA
jgi:hypothetical protein